MQSIDASKIPARIRQYVVLEHTVIWASALYEVVPPVQPILSLLSLHQQGWAADNNLVAYVCRCLLPPAPASRTSCCPSGRS